MPTLPCDVPVMTLSDSDADFRQISTNFDRFNEYGLIISATEEGLRKGIEQFPCAMYCGKGDLSRPYKIGPYYYVTYSKSRSCD